MSDRIEVKITASNGTSQVFRAVASDAQTMGTAVEQAGKKGSASFKAWGDAARNVGAALGATTAIALRAAGEAEAAEARLSTAFTNAGLAVEDYQDRIDKLANQGLDLGFDDEDTTDALASLVTATGDYEQAVRDLAIAQDLARSQDESLSAATDQIVAAEAGRYRSLQSLGIQLDATATSEEALAAVQQKVSGSAEAFAQTGAADFARWGNAAENALEAVGAKLTSIQGPLLALSAGSTLIGGMAGPLKALVSQVGLTSAALGPAGLVAAAAAAAGGLVLLAKHIDSTKLSAGEATKLIDDFNASISELGAAGAPVALTQTLASFNDELQLLASNSAAASEKLGELRDNRDRLQSDMMAANINPDVNPAVVKGYEAQIAAIDDQIAALERAEVSETEYADAQRIVLDLVQRTGQVNYPILIDRLNEMSAALADGTMTGDDYIWNLRYLEENAATYGVTLGELAEQQRAATITATEFGRAMERQSGAITAQTSDLQQLVSARQAAADARFAQAEEIQTSMASLAAESVTDLTESRKADVAAIQAQIAAITDYATALGQMPSGDTFGSRLADRASAAGTALGDAFRTGVGNVGDLGGQAQKVADWAGGLTDVADGYSELNRLFDEGRLSVGEYNAGVEAGNRILSENAEIQNNVLDIQATQLPILADLTAQQQRYLEHIARQPAEVQAVALAYMDADTSAKALEASQLAAAAAAGELGSAGKDVATNLIQGAVAADPYLAALLEDMNLISVGADGTITVNFDSVESANASLDDVVDALDDLSSLLASVFGILIDDSQVTTGSAHVTALATDVGNLDGATAGISVSSNALAVAADVGAVQGALAALDGKTATATVVTNYVSTGTQPGFIPIAGRHGGVMGYADGGIVARMAEAGPELLHFANGGMGMAMSDGLYSVPRGTYVTPAPASKGALGGLTVQFQGPVTIVANNPREFAQALYEHEMGGVRG